MSCELEDFPEEELSDLPGREQSACSGLYILSEGLFNMNNSSLAYYSFQDKCLKKNFFTLVNQRGLGDTGNDMKSYGGKLYIVVNVSSQIEVLDLAKGTSLAQIPLFDEKGRGRQPRYIDFYEGKAYVCSFDGSLARIDTADYQVEAYVACGRNPDGICISNGKIYVANSGGLDNPDFDKTVSVVDIETFSERKKIEVGLNPYKMYADSQGDVYVAFRGDLQTSSYGFQRIDTQKDIVVQSFDDIHAANFTLFHDTAYILHSSTLNGENRILVFDCLNEKLLQDAFVPDSSVRLVKPYGLSVNPYNGDVYVTDAYNYTLSGDCYCFSPEGRLKFRFGDIGLNPCSMVFVP